MRKELWKPVVGFESFYEVSDCGLVRSKHTIGRPALCGILSQHTNAKGYKRVGLSVNSKRFSIMVHRLVLEAFVGPQPSVIHQTNHKNGRKSNSN